MGPARDDRPWGHFRVLADGGNYRIKEIVVRAGMRLSLQRHRHRDEHWYVVTGEGLMTCGDHARRMEPGCAIDIPRGAWHRIANPGPADLLLIEIQTGDYFGEDDIERREDDFGRA